MVNLHNGRYIATYDPDTARGPVLVIERSGESVGGRYVEGELAREWAHHIRTAMDKSEANSICRAILDS